MCIYNKGVDMRTFKLEATNKNSSVLGLGTMIFAPNKKDLCFEILENFTSNGGTFIDTAEIYGDPEEHGYSEQTLGMWFDEVGKREEIVLCSKGLIPDTCNPIHPNGLKITPEHIHSAISGSLDRLKTDYLDVWLFHRDDESLEVGPLVEACVEEIEQGRIRAYGGSNWTTRRIQEARNYAESHGMQPMSLSSPHFSLAVAKEPYWPNTVVVTNEEKQWYKKNNFPLLAWSSLGRGFIAKGSPNFTEDENLVRVYYNEENFNRLSRADIIGKKYGLNRIETALAYVLSQSFPTIALVGAANKREMLSCIKAAEIIFDSREISYLEGESS
jgi:aryl-alcohol dehydrogenase-like predicted oxidoreductase